MVLGQPREEAEGPEVAAAVEFSRTSEWYVLLTWGISTTRWVARSE